MSYRVALHGFSEFERLTLTFCLKHAAARRPAYVQVDRLADSDFIVADAAHGAIAGSVTRGERLHDTLFIGDNPPFGASAHLRRPIDPERILRVLDELAMQRGPRGTDGRPDIVLPLAAADAAHTAELSHRAAENVETTPAAFRYEPVAIQFNDTDRLGSPDTAASPLDGPDTAPTPLEEAGPVTRLNGSWRHAAPTVPASLGPVPQPPGREAAVASPALLARLEDAAAPPAVAMALPPATKARLSDAERAEAKAAARRKSRLARQMQDAAAAAAAPHAVLLLDNAVRPTGLAVLLEAFGFVVHRADSIAAAIGVLERAPLAAAFVDLSAEDPDGLDGLELCQQIKQRRLPLAGAAPAVMLLADGESAADRVRAKLAGSDAFLTRPMTRGDVARALESCHVLLPADARRA